MCEEYLMEAAIRLIKLMVSESYQETEIIKFVQQILPNEDVTVIKKAINIFK